MDPWLGVGLLVGAGLAAIYALLAHRHSNPTETLSFFRLLLAGAAAGTASKLTYLAVTTSDAELRPFTDEDRLYIIIGALVLFAVAYSDSRRELGSA